MMLKVGDLVLYASPVRKVSYALVTAAWSNDYLNLVVVSDDEKMTDQYGRQIGRETSVPRYSEATKGGRCFEELGDSASLEDFAAKLNPVPQQV